MDRSKFIQSSSWIRVLEKRLLSHQFFLRLADAPSLKDALRMLNDTIYQTSISKLEKDTDYEKALSQELLRFYKEMYEISPSNIPIDFTVLKYYYHNLKVMAKEYVQKEDLSHLYIPLGNLDIFGLRKLLQENTSAKNEYLREVKETIRLYEKTKRPSDIDIYLDRCYFKSLLKLADEADEDIFYSYVKDTIDFKNIRSLMRANAEGADLEFLTDILIDGGNIYKDNFYNYLNTKIEPDSKLFKYSNIYKYVKQGTEFFGKGRSLSRFELLVDNEMVDLIKNAKKITYGPEVVFAHVIAKEIELRNLRIIFVAKQNGLSSEFIRERLRDTYV